MNDLSRFALRPGEIVSFHRHKAGLTQIQLSKLAGVGKTTVFDIEKGKPTVRFNSIFSVLSALNVQIKFTGPLMGEFTELPTSRRV